MRLTTRTISCCTAGIALLLAGCGTKPAATAPSAGLLRHSVAELSPRELDAMVAAIHHEMADSPPDGEIAFVSIGPDGKDPPDEMIRRLTTAKRLVRPASVARFPKLGEMESPDVARGIEDPVTGRRTTLYHVEVVKWECSTKVQMRVVATSGPLSGGERELTLDSANGQWTVEKIGHSLTY